MGLVVEDIDIDVAFTELKPKIDMFFKKGAICDEKSAQQFFLYLSAIFCIKYDAECYLVGGYIRDKFMGTEQEHCDIDIHFNKFLSSAASFISYASTYYMPNNPIRIIKPVSRKPMYSIYLKTKMSCDLVPEGFDMVQLWPNSNILEEIKKLDLTINSLALDLTKKRDFKKVFIMINNIIYKKGVDKSWSAYVYGLDSQVLQDLKNRCIRMRNPNYTKTEYLMLGRVIKFLERYHNQLNQFTIEPETLKTISNLRLRSRYVLGKDYSILNDLAKKKSIDSNPKYSRLFDILNSYRLKLSVEKKLGNQSYEEFLQYVDAVKRVDESFSDSEQRYVWDNSIKDIREALFLYYITDGDMHDFDSFKKYLLIFLKEKYPEIPVDCLINYFGEKNILHIFEKRLFDKSSLTDAYREKIRGAIRHHILQVLYGEGKNVSGWFLSKDKRVFNLIKQYSDAIGGFDGFFNNNSSEFFFNINNLKNLSIQNKHIFSEISNLGLNPLNKNHIIVTRLISLLSSYYINKKSFQYNSSEIIYILSEDDKELINFTNVMIKNFFLYRDIILSRKNINEDLIKNNEDIYSWILLREIYLCSETFNGEKFKNIFGENRIVDICRSIVNLYISQLYKKTA